MICLIECYILRGVLTAFNHTNQINDFREDKKVADPAKK
jgi:hypothetical protein